MTTIAIIPVRMGSSRLPGKPLKLINGIPMLAHVFWRTKMAKKLSAVYVATCDQAIYDYCLKINAPCVMTANTHERCSDRTAEAMLKIEQTTGELCKLVVMVQGDEPMITGEMVDHAITALEQDAQATVVNLMTTITTAEEHVDPNEIKVVTDLANNALYFSRQPIPHTAHGKSIAAKKQVCVIPFRRDTLLTFNQMPATPLEQAESVDMMRFLENGLRVKMIETHAVTYSVDTPADLQRVEQLMRVDPLINQYPKLATPMTV